MGFAVKVEAKNAEGVRRFLQSMNLLEGRKQVSHDSEFVIFPVNDLVTQGEEAKVIELGGELIEFEAVERKDEYDSIEDALKGQLTEEELKGLVKGFDIVGDIATIEIPEELEAKEKLIAQALMSVHKNVNVVCKKVSGRHGAFRVQGLTVIAGENRTETLYSEHGCRMKVDLSKAYFSPRLSTERKIIAEKVKEGETVAVLFAGVGPYAFVICKEQPLVGKVYAVELNPDAVNYLEENVKLNKVEGTVMPLLEDAGKACREELRGKCDRVIMPLPHEAQNFLDDAIKALKAEGGFIHFYQFCEEGKFKEAEDKVTEAASRAGRKVKTEETRKVGMHSPRVYRVCVDALIT